MHYKPVDNRIPNFFQPVTKRIKPAQFVAVQYFLLTRGRNFFENKTFKAAVDRDWLRSHHLGITAVPTFRMNEENLVGAQPYEQLAAFMTAQRVPSRNVSSILYKESQN